MPSPPLSGLAQPAASPISIHSGPPRLDTAPPIGSSADATARVRLEPHASRFQVGVVPDRGA